MPSTTIHCFLRKVPRLRTNSCRLVSDKNRLSNLYELVLDSEYCASIQSGRFHQRGHFMGALDSLPLTGIPPEDEALRAEVRALLAESVRQLPAATRSRSWSGCDTAFSRELGRRGWLGITFPVAYGGAGRSPFARYVLV